MEWFKSSPSNLAKWWFSFWGFWQKKIYAWSFARDTFDEQRDTSRWNFRDTVHCLPLRRFNQQQTTSLFYRELHIGRILSEEPFWNTNTVPANCRSLCRDTQLQWLTFWFDIFGVGIPVPMKQLDVVFCFLDVEMSLELTNIIQPYRLVNFPFFVFVSKWKRRVKHDRNIVDVTWVNDKYIF